MSDDKTTRENMHVKPILMRLHKINLQLGIGEGFNPLCQEWTNGVSGATGRRSGRSCEQAGATLVNHIAEATDKNLYSVAIFCDISKAFHSIPHDRFLSKLDRLGFRGHSLLGIAGIIPGRERPGDPLGRSSK